MLEQTTKENEAVLDLNDSQRGAPHLELADLQLSFVGGGIGTVVFA